MAPRPDVSAERRQQILDAALKVFSRLGFCEARMDDIVDESGLSKGALYWYFKSKDEIIISIMDQLFSREMDDLRRMVESEGSARGRLLTVGRSVVAEFTKMASLMPVAYEFYAQAPRRPEVRESLNRYYQEYLMLLARMIEQGVRDTEFREVNESEVAIALAALVEGLALLWVLDPKTVDLEAVSETAFDLLINGLLPRPSS